MDDVFERMQAFRTSLQRFQDALEASLADVTACHGDVDPLWPPDEFRRLYDGHYGPLHDTLVAYVRTQGPDYLNFLDEKLRAIDAYLNG